MPHRRHPLRDAPTNDGHLVARRCPYSTLLAASHGEDEYVCLSYARRMYQLPSEDARPQLIPPDGGDASTIDDAGPAFSVQKRDVLCLVAPRLRYISVPRHGLLGLP